MAYRRKQNGPEFPTGHPDCEILKDRRVLPTLRIDAPFSKRQADAV